MYVQCENNSKYKADSKVILSNLKISFNSKHFVIRKYKETKNFVTYYDAYYFCPFYTFYSKYVVIFEQMNENLLIVPIRSISSSSFSI